MGHSRLPASAASRWIRCPGSIAYVEYLRREKMIGESFSGAPARLGTAVHSIIEHCIINRTHPKKLSTALIKKILKSDSELKDVVIDTKAIDGATTCVDRVDLIRPEFDEVFAERKYDLSFIYNIDVGGTCDISGFSKKLLGIEDYKNGRIPVEAEDNYQLKIYALGAYHNENEWYGFKKVRTTIIQPNAPHMLGRIRSDEFSIDDLRRWEEKKVIPAINLIANNTATLTPGPIQCTWCEGRHLCEANASQSLQLAQIDFANVAEPRPELPAPKSLTRDQLSFILDNKQRLLQFLNTCEAYAMRILEDEDEHIGEYALTEKKGNRKFIGTKDLKSVIRKNKLTVKECTINPDSHLMSVTQLESYLKSDKGWDKDRVFEFMSKVTERPVTGKQLTKHVDNAKSDFSDKAKLSKKPKIRKIRSKRSKRSKRK